jgi:hypothetical protein
MLADIGLPCYGSGCPELSDDEPECKIVPIPLCCGCWMRCLNFSNLLA